MGSSGCGERSWTRRPRALAELLLLAVGRIGGGPEAALVTRYAARLRPALRVVELPDGRGSPAEIMRREAIAVQARLPAHALVVALDRTGTAPDSPHLARLLTLWSQTGRPVCFVIGGAEGLDQRLVAAAFHVLSLGPLTWPHMLARAMLAEQLFRAQSIAAGHPYHRGPRDA